MADEAVEQASRHFVGTTVAPTTSATKRGRINGKLFTTRPQPGEASTIKDFSLEDLILLGFQKSLPRLRQTLLIKTNTTSAL